VEEKGMNDRLQDIMTAVVMGGHAEIEDKVGRAVEAGEDLNRIIQDALIPAMDIVGQRFSAREIFVPEMLVSALTMKKGLEIIKPRLEGEKSRGRGTILMGTVKGDLHDIGKNLVIMMLEGAGFNVVDMGVDLSVEKVVEKVDEIRPHILGLSALLTTTLPEMKKVIEVLEQKGLRKKVKVLVGGAPVDAAFAREIGADGYGKDAVEAVRLARGFVECSKECMGYC
jgi:5-methyltetrahydrofolate--homocysteine methyltransferase